jgi:iron complex outermembrane recepter protein
MLATTIISGMAFAAPAFAQTAPATAEPEVVVVTGTRIQNPNIQSASPIQVVGQESISKAGLTRIEDVLNRLPAVQVGQSGGSSNGATGTATVDLRGLGVERTLVLIDGRRLVPGTPLQTAPDLNSIPGPLVERIEVLTGGASAVYGADAISGVVNFVTKKNFEGVEFSASHGFYMHHNDNPVASVVRARGFALPKEDRTDGRSSQLSVVLGVNAPDDKGNVTMYMTYRNIDPVLQGTRDFSSCVLNEVSPTSNSFFCGGSGAGPASVRFRSTQFGTGAVTARELSLNANGTLRPFDSATDAYNFAPLNFYQRPDERYSIGATGNYTINEHAEVFTQLMMMDNRTVAQIAPSGLFAGTTYQLPCNNAFLTAEQRTSFCTSVGAGINDTVNMRLGRRLVEGGGRQNDLRHTSYRGVLGLRGQIDNIWSYDVSAQYGTTSYQNVYLNDISLSKVNLALTATRNLDGTITCSAAALASDARCRPLNIFTPGGIKKDATDFLKTPAFQRGTTQETVVIASASGDLTEAGVKTPWSAEGVQVAFGMEYRLNKISLLPDEIFQLGLLVGQGGTQSPVDGGFNVIDVFGEASIPLVEDKPFMKELGLEIGYRASNYNTLGNTAAYKIAATWSPVDDFRVRGGYNRAVRAPNVNELFRNRDTGLWSGTDGCAGATPQFTRAQCLRTGVSAANYGTIVANGANQYGNFTGGNPNLQEEQADTISIGAIYRPSFAPGLTMSVDYYDIKIDNRIGGLGAQFVLNACALGGAQTLGLCALIERDSLGSLDSDGRNITDTDVNAGYLQSRGIDFEAGYRFDLDALGLKDLGSVRADFNGTLLLEKTREVGVVNGALVALPDGSGNLVSSYDCTGLFGPTCEEPSSKWRHNLSLTWTTPQDISLGLTWRHIGGVDLEKTSSNPFLKNTVNKVNEKIDAFNYLDLQASWDVTSNYTLRLSANNVFDTDPPILGQADLPPLGNGGTIPALYDTLGRYISFGVTAKF